MYVDGKQTRELDEILHKLIPYIIRLAACSLIQKSGRGPISWDHSWAHSSRIRIFYTAEMRGDTMGRGGGGEVPSLVPLTD
jgi:hypothetical protein